MEGLNSGINIYLDCSTEFAMINEYITYSIFLENTTDRDIDNFFLSINVPINTEYCDDSLISSENYEISKKESGIIFEKLKAKSTVNVFYKVEILEVPGSGAIANRNFITYKSDEGKEIVGASNGVSTKIKGALIKKEEGFRKSIIDGQLKVGEIITFEIIIKNTGNLTAFDLFFTDILPENITALLDKVIINNRILSLNSLKNISLGNLGAFKSINIRYKAIIDYISKDDGVFSLAKLSYRYFNDVINDYIDGEAVSNEVSLNVKEVVIREKEDFYCIIEKNKCLINEELNCKFVIKNSGNTEGSNSIFSINLSEGLVIKDNLLMINGKEVLFNSLNKINLGNLKLETEDIIEFNLIAKGIKPRKKLIEGTLLYNYMDLEVGEIVSKSSKSNVIELDVFGTIINDNEKLINKTVSKSCCKLGEEIEHNIKLSNKGNLKGSNLIFNEIEDYGEEFVLGSFKIDGEPVSVRKTDEGILIGDIDPGKEVDISYKSKITAIPRDEVIRSRAYIEFNEGNNNRKKLWCRENEIEVIGAKVQGEVILESFYNYKGDNLLCKIIITNLGNKRAKDIKIKLGGHTAVTIEKISYIKEENKVEIKGNYINLESLEPLENVELNLEVSVNREYLRDDIFISGEIEYFYFSDKEEKVIENQKYLITREFMNIINGDLDLKYESSVKGIDGEEEFSVNLIIKNTGNINLNNIVLRDIIPHSVELLYANERVENNNINIGDLKVSEEKIITLLLKGRAQLVENNITIKARLEYEYYKNSLVKEEKEFEPLTIELINGYLDVNLVNEKSEVLVNESFSNVLTFKNKGSYSLKNTKLYFILNNLKNTKVDPIILVNNKLCKINKDENSIELYEIAAGEIIVVKFNVNSAVANEVKFYCKIAGNYNFIKNKDWRDKSFYSNEVTIKVHKVSLNNFLSADKDILYKGDDIKYNSVIINDGTLPIDFSYKMNVSKSLIAKDKGFIVNGIILEDKEEYKGTIEPSEGIVIEEVYLYNNAFGGNRVFGESIINYSYSLNGEGEKVNKELKSEKVLVEAASTTFKEVIVEHKEALIEFQEELVSVSNVYVTPTILNYYIVDKFKNINSDNEIISSTKVIIKGLINLKVEYISKTNNIYVHSKHLDFVTFMILPKEYKEGEKIDITAKLEDIYYKIIDLSYLFLNINIIIKALF